MKPIVAVLGLFAAVAAGAVGGIVAAPSAAPAPTDGALAAAPKSAPASVAAAHETIDTSDVGRQLAELSNEVARLRAELSAVREGRVRETAAPEQVASKEDLPEESFAILHRDAILRVIADERADLQRKEEEARKQRELEQSQQRAERVAKDLGMSTTETRKLAEVYALERDKRDEFMKTMRSGDMPDREQMRQTFTEFRDWRTSALTNALGPDLAAKVNEYDGDRGFGGRFGDFGGPGGGGGNGGGNANRPNGNGGNGNRNGRRNGNNGNNAPANGGGTGGG